MKSINAETSVKTTALAVVPALKNEKNSSAQNLLMSLMGTNETHSVAYGTEAGLFQNQSIPSIICGPGSIDQAHKPNEFIEKKQIIECEIFIEKLIDYLTEK